MELAYRCPICEQGTPVLITPLDPHQKSVVRCGLKKCGKFKFNVPDFDSIDTEKLVEEWNKRVDKYEESQAKISSYMDCIGDIPGMT